MELKATQAKIAAAIAANPEAVIAAALLFNDACAPQIAAAAKATGPRTGVAAVAVQFALRGKDTAATLENMCKFAAII